ncbi:Presenilin-1 [Podila verticillata]|nr:Presenilin-1 [Podila verticillata]
MSTHEAGPAGQAPSHRNMETTPSVSPDPRHALSSPSSDNGHFNNRSSNNNLGNNSQTQEQNLDTGGEDQPCQVCGSFPARFQCSACQSVRYCSQECQASDWRIHYRECAEITASTRAADHDENGGAQFRAGRDQEHQARSISTTGSRTIAAEGGTETTGASPEDLRAIADRPRRRPREPRQRPRMTPEQRAAFEEAERIADMKFYMLQIYKIIKPVVVCIFLSILWVKVSMAGSDYRPTQSTYTVYKETATSTVSQNIVGSLANAGIIIGQIVIVTIIIVVLFKRGHIKVLIGFFMVVVAMLLGFMGYILILNLIQVLRIPLDYITMSFALWNFAVAGLISVFWKGPMWLQQIYLTVMSSLMAFSLTGLAEWTTWMLLALLVIWDLIAVLCPFGPLKILVESSRNQNQEVPALLYTVNAVWFMAAPPNAITEREDIRNKEEHEDLSMDNHNFIGHSRATGRDGGTSVSSSSRNSGLDVSFGTGGTSRASSTMELVPSTTRGDMSDDRENIELRDRDRHRSGGSPNTRVQESQRRDRDQGRASDENITSNEDDDDDDGGGLKLGLGDFVFYSVLVARAAMFDWVTTICCMVAVLTGMNATIFLLAIYQKALPALPISICFGMLFYFATRFALVPFLAVLGPAQVFI